MIRIYIIQAEFGDALLVEFGKTKSKFILIDGGPANVFDNYLKEELLDIVGEGGTLELLVISHVDDDHIKGIVDLLVELKRAGDMDEKPMLNVKNLWHNSFSDVIDPDGSVTNRLTDIYTVLGQNAVASPNATMVFEGIKEGNKVTGLAAGLKIPVNEQSTGGFFTLEKSNDAIAFDNLSIEIIGPTKENLEALKEKWEEWLEKQKKKIEKGKVDSLAMADRSVPNLSSIVFLMTVGKKTVLFTGDARADFIYQGLKKRKMLDEDGSMHVNVLKVPHHGSDRNIDRAFFENVTADTYIISANGKYGNPDYATLTWIIESANQQERKIQIIVTNQTDMTKKIQKDYSPKEWGYSIRFIAEGKSSILLDW
jgi:beta-lactamase superfamily II metal-dependent hydrolase